MADELREEPLVPIDGIRGIAILMVIFYHGVELFSTRHALASPLLRLAHRGWMGVDLFFVVSGFLITGILLRHRDEPDLLRTFWIRRSLRIFPLALLYMGLLQAHELMGRPLVTSIHFTHGWMFFLYLGNFQVAWEGLRSLPVTILWSLAVEEQFYLVWPLVVRGVPMPSLRDVVLATIFICPILRYLVINLVSDISVYVLPFCRADSLAFGCLLALLHADPAGWARTRTGLRRAIPLAIAGFLLTPVPAPGESMPVWSAVLGYSAIAASCGILLAACLEPGWWMHRVVSMRVLVHAGRRCYGLYIWHPLLGVLGKEYLPGAGAWLPLAWLVAAFLAAEASWHLLERPFLRLKRHFPHRRG